MLLHYFPKIGRFFGISFEARDELEVMLQWIDRRGMGNKYPDWGKEVFLKTLPTNSKILDVGCGNNSPFYTKSIAPDCYYVGLDIGEYNQKKPNLADEYIVVAPEDFVGEIRKFKNCFDAVISSHNLEHCGDREGVLLAMLYSIKENGMLYISFPSVDSISFPARAGSLNYKDDSTHEGLPPDFGEIISIISSKKFDITYATTRYQPPIRWLIGLFHEFESASERAVKAETWAFWGFETVIWARKKSSVAAH